MGAPTESPPPGIRRQLLRRMPLLIAAAVGLWLLSGPRPQETVLVYRLDGRAEALSSLEVQLLELPDAELVRRTEFRFDPSRPAPRELNHPLSLEPGAYRVEARFHYGDAEAPQRLERSLSFDGEERIVINLAQ